MRHLDLFSGIGGFALAARWAGIETVAFCEIAPECRKVLHKHWPAVKKYNDIREVAGADYKGINIITGGYPCQPFSVAGSQKAQKMTATSGRKCCELLHKQNQLGQFVKMFMVMSDWDWTVCSMIWRPSATPHNRLLFQLLPQVETITGAEFLLWPTPQAMDAMKARPAQAMKRQMDTARKGRTKIATMKDAAVYGLEWTGKATRLGAGELSPRHLEWMMNYPDGWTETEC